MSEPNSTPPPELEELTAEMIAQQQVDEARQKSAEFYDQLLRLQAEFDNYRKRVEKEKTDARQWGRQDVLVPLLSLVDIFEQAIVQAAHAKDVKQLAQGLGFLHKNFDALLRSQGLEPLDVIGKPFDPHVAEAVEQVEVDEESQVGIVLSELQKGYSFQGKNLLRPSRVRVGVAKKTAATDSETQAD